MPPAMPLLTKLVTATEKRTCRGRAQSSGYRRRRRRSERPELGRELPVSFTAARTHFSPFTPSLCFLKTVLTLPDLNQARAFFCGELRFAEAGGVPDYPSIFVSDGTILLTLWRAADPVAAREFDRHANISFHHLSLTVADDAALAAAWDAVTAHPEAVVDTVPGAMRPGSTTRHLIIFIPGRIRLEFATPFT